MSPEAPSAARVDQRTYFSGKVEPRGSVDSLYCPECQSPRVFTLGHHQPLSGPREYVVQCNACKTTWIVNGRMTEKLGLFPGEKYPDLDRDSLRGF
jgi:hypothetical protein